jgi:hypothetical protein
MHIYYVYAYINKKTGQPYYIGKGKEGRAYSTQHSVSVPKDKSKIVFLEQNLSNVGACALERRYIRWYGRKDLGTGILLNRTDGGDGTVGKHGIKRPDFAKYNMTRQHPFQGKDRPEHSSRMKGSGNPNYGKKTSPEKSEKIRESLKLYYLKKKLSSTDSVLVEQPNHGKY